jgi:hypothetical protein
VSCTVGCSSDEVPEELLVGTAGRVLFHLQNIGLSSSVVSSKRRPYVRIRSVCANERLNRVAGFRLNSVKKREFCEKRLKDSHEFRENLCYENCNFLVGANEILPKFSAFFVRR